MTEQDINKLKERVLQLFAKHPKETFKPRVLARRLAIKELADFRLLLRVLNELHQSKSIERGHRKQYGHALPPPSARLTGVLSFARSGSGFVRLSELPGGMVSISARFLGTAVVGDTVSVSLFAPMAETTQGSEQPGEPEGEIIEVLERSRRPIVGVFERGKHFSFVVPDGKLVDRDIYIPQGESKGAHPGQKVVAVIDAWESRNLNPEGHIVEILGRAGEVSAEMSAVARQFQLPLSFPKDVISEAETIEPEIPKTEINKRLDLRAITCFTIDPEDAKDFDDAVSLERLENGDLRLGVHIADVSHYVRDGSILDEEAYRRGTSVYLADEVIPMLPEKLSNNLCSLRPNVDRLAYSALMTLSPAGAVKDYELRKSIIHSKRRFTYEEAQQIIEARSGDFATELLAMHKLSQQLLAKRRKEGSIDFETVETKFRFDDEGKPSEILKKVRLDAHRLVEEFMLLANQVVAKHIGLPKREEQRRPFVYRIHDSPPPDKLSTLASFVDHLGYSLNLSGGVVSRALQKLLKDIKGKPEENVITVIAIRSMAKAVYSEHNIGHFGLGFKHYTHFTSPIRRYPDLIVHRLLHEYEGKMAMKRLDALTTSLPDVCRHSSDRERVAAEAERASIRVMQVEYMKRHVGDEFHALISGVTNFGIFVEITDLLVEGLIRVRDMKDDYYVFDEKHFTLIGKRTKKKYRLGDKVDVQVARVDPESRQIDFVLIE